MLNTRHDRINALAQINSASTYLEIGVCYGLTFQEIKIPHKVGVDPYFRFDVQSQASETIHFHQMTSDAFFETQASSYGKFDLIYLDGLHTFDQTLRDFQNSLRYAHHNTIWLIDDTHPNGLLAAHPNYFLVKVLRRLFWIKEEAWMGDVFKVIFAIHDFFTDYRYSTFNNHGQTVIWQDPRHDSATVWSSETEIQKLGYQDFLKHKESMMNFADPDQILIQLKNRFRLTH